MFAMTIFQVHHHHHRHQSPSHLRSRKEYPAQNGLEKMAFRKFDAPKVTFLEPGKKIIEQKLFVIEIIKFLPVVWQTTTQVCRAVFRRKATLAGLASKEETLLERDALDEVPASPMPYNQTQY